MLRNVLIAVAVAAAATLALVTTSQAAARDEHPQRMKDVVVAYVDEVIAEQSMDRRRRPIGPKRLVEVGKRSPDASALRAALERPLQSVAVRESAGRSLQSTGCKTVWATRIGRSWFRSVLWKYTQEKFFCWASPRITYVRVNAYPCCTDPFWTWKGHLAKRSWYFKWSGNYRGGHYSFRQGKFRQDLVKFSLSTRLPWVKLWVYGNGGWAYKTGS